ncbi:MAG: hypothetical protein IMY78_02355, partial [Chloroflexi bacterium]|nr:hypothetical protein [Chloroflexota bacterium]
MFGLKIEHFSESLKCPKWRSEMRGKVPQQLLVGAARQWLLRHYKENEDFAKERQLIQSKYRGTLQALLACAEEAFDQHGMSKKSRDDTTKYAQDSPELIEYANQLSNLCTRWKLDYPWAPGLLLWDDIYETVDKTAEMDIAIASTLFSAMTGLPPTIMIELPTYALYVGKRRQVHRIIDAILDQLPEIPDWQDVPHGISLHTKWLYANRVLNMSPEDIYEDPELNPGGGNMPRADVPHIR